MPAREGGNGHGWPAGVGSLEYVTAAQAAAYLQVHVRTIYAMALDGRLTAHRLGSPSARNKRFRRTDVEGLLSAEDNTDDTTKG